jgi:hypothetical protein
MLSWNVTLIGSRSFIAQFYESYSDGNAFEREFWLKSRFY